MLAILESSPTHVLQQIVIFSNDKTVIAEKLQSSKVFEWWKKGQETESVLYM